jgi:hemerythrin-like domain-containing protein
MNDNAKDSVDDALSGDHLRLDALLEELTRAVSDSAPAGVELLGRLKEGLQYHMSWENQSLFPAVKALGSAKERRSIESLEIDHERLRETLQNLESFLAAGDFAAAEPGVRWLKTLLQGHNYDEEHGVYVDADRLLSPAERRSLIERFEGGRNKEAP